MSATKYHSGGQKYNILSWAFMLTSVTFACLFFFSRVLGISTSTPLLIGTVSAVLGLSYNMVLMVMGHYLELSAPDNTNNYGDRFTGLIVSIILCILLIAISRENVMGAGSFVAETLVNQVTTAVVWSGAFSFIMICALFYFFKKSWRPVWQARRLDLAKGEYEREYNMIINFEDGKAFEPEQFDNLKQVYDHAMSRTEENLVKAHLVDLQDLYKGIKADRSIMMTVDAIKSEQ